MSTKAKAVTDATYAEADRAMNQAAREFERAMEAIVRARTAANDACIAAEPIASAHVLHRWAPLHGLLDRIHAEMRAELPAGAKMTAVGDYWRP